MEDIIKLIIPCILGNLKSFFFLHVYIFTEEASQNILNIDYKIKQFWAELRYTVTLGDS